MEVTVHAKGSEFWFRWFCEGTKEGAEDGADVFDKVALPERWKWVRLVVRHPPIGKGARTSVTAIAEKRHALAGELEPQKVAEAIRSLLT